MSRRDASAPWACRPEPKVPSRTPDEVGDTQHQPRTGDASAPWACRPEPSAQPRARWSRRHTAPAAPTWCLCCRSLAHHHTAIFRRIGHSSTATPSPAAVSARAGGADCDGSGMRAQPAANSRIRAGARCECAVGRPQQHSHTITSCGLGTAGVPVLSCPAARQTESATHSTRSSNSST